MSRHNMKSKRVELTLECDVALRLQAEMRRTGKSLDVLVNERLRSAFVLQSECAAAPRFEVTPFDLGLPLPGIHIDNVGALLSQLEGPAYR